VSSPSVVDAAELVDVLQACLDPQEWTADWQQGHADPDASIRRLLAQ
jgi:hypothetical protein